MTRCTIIIAKMFAICTKLCYCFSNIFSFESLKYIIMPIYYSYEYKFSLCINSFSLPYISMYMVRQHIFSYVFSFINIYPPLSTYMHLYIFFFFLSTSLLGFPQFVISVGNGPLFCQSIQNTEV